MAAKRLVSIIVPVYHNAGSLAELHQRFCAVAERHPERFEFIFVDDGSTDGSFAVMQDLAERDERVRAVRLTRNFGSSAAAAAGVAVADGDAFVVISADLQDPPELVEGMLERWRAGSKIVLAARRRRGDPLLNSALSGIYWRLFRRFAIPSMPERGCDFCLFDRVVVEALHGSNEPLAGLGMILWTGFEPAVIEYDRRQRDPRHGRSMWTTSKKITYFIDTFVSFSHVPIRAASALGILLALLGIGYAWLVVASRLFFATPIEQGWASLMVVMLVVSGTQLLMIGILGEYLVRTLEATRRRPAYVIERIVRSKNSAPAAAAGARDEDEAAARSS